MDNDNSTQVVFIGETNTGKTSLINRLVNGTFDSEYKTTLNAPQITYKGNKITFQITDTPGQEKFRGLNKFYIKKAKIICLVYDITNRSSFDELEKYWYNEIKEYNSYPSILYL